MPFVSLGAACYMVVFALIGLTKVNPIGPIVLSSFALSFNILPWIGSIPLVVTDHDLIGTAYGVFSSFVITLKLAISESVLIADCVQ